MPLIQSDREYLQSLIDSARSSPPTGWSPWFLEGSSQSLGVISPERAQLFRQCLPDHAPLVQEVCGWIWMAQQLSARERGCILHEVALQLRGLGAVVGWRDEAYSCWSAQEAVWPYPQPEWFRLERAAFRFWGLRSHASHVHGLTADGRMWCGRRALNKATDPGLLDNLAAGGLPADEHPHHCAVREIFEEAGLERDLPQVVSQAQVLITERAEPQGWHSETIFHYTTQVLDHEIPTNQDGEVSEFLCLEMDEVLWRMQAGEFTHDAACAIATYLLNHEPRY